MLNSRALIVEDDKDVAELYSHVLHSLGFQNEMIRTGEEALARLANTAPALVLLDLNLPPKISGAEVLRYIRAEPRLKGTCVIVVTGHPELAETVRGECEQVLIKPVDVDRLNDLVSHLVLAA